MSNEPANEDNYCSDVEEEKEPKKIDVTIEQYLWAKLQLALDESESGDWILDRCDFKDFLKFVKAHSTVT